MFVIPRTDLRQNQSWWLKKACSQRVLLIKSSDKDDENLVLGKQYFDETRATLEIGMDQKLFNRILSAADTLDEDLRFGRLHSLEDVFAED